MNVLRWKVALYLVAIFAAGSVSGWVLGAKTAKQQMLKPPPQGDIVRHMQQDMKNQLALTPEQAEKIDQIFAKFSAEMKPLLDNHMAKVRQTVSERNSQIAAILTAEQQTKFEQLEKQRREQWQSRRHRGPRNPTNNPGDVPPPPKPPADR